MKCFEGSKGVECRNKGKDKNKGITAGFSIVENDVVRNMAISETEISEIWLISRIAKF